MSVTKATYQLEVANRGEMDHLVQILVNHHPNLSIVEQTYRQVSRYDNPTNRYIYENRFTVTVVFGAIRTNEDQGSGSEAAAIDLDD